MMAEHGHRIGLQRRTNPLNGPPLDALLPTFWKRPETLEFAFRNQEVFGQFSDDEQQTMPAGMYVAWFVDDIPSNPFVGGKATRKRKAGTNLVIGRWQEFGE